MQAHITHTRIQAAVAQAHNFVKLTCTQANAETYSVLSCQYTLILLREKYVHVQGLMCVSVCVGMCNTSGE